MKPLVIIDMQPHDFETADNHRTVHACMREIERAVKRNDFVVFVEYVYQGGANIQYGDTDIRLTEIVENYHRKIVVKKQYDDGGNEIAQALRKHCIYPDELIVCGVNIEACVGQTVKTLHEEGYSVKLVADAINGKRDGHSRVREMTFLSDTNPSVRIVNGHKVSRKAMRELKEEDACA